MFPIIITAIIIAMFIANVFFVEYESYGWTTLSMIVTGVAIYWFKLWGLPQWIVNHGLLCLAFDGAYIVIGIIWSFIKWFSYLISYRDHFLDIKNDYVNSRNDLIESQWKWIQDNYILNDEGNLITKDILPFIHPYGMKTNNVIEKYLSQVKDGNKLYHNFSDDKRKYCKFYKPLAYDNKSKIVAWICYWPFSLIGTLINDPLRRLVNFCFAKLKATYQKMSDSVFKEFPDKNEY
jgi:hypothetical protein